MRAPLPPDETGRLNALQQYHILDTEPEQAFDDLTLLASQICGANIAMISLIDQNRQWFKSKIGITTNETPRDMALSAYGILKPEVLVVPDALADRRFAENPRVTGAPGIRFYAGGPLITPDGHVIGMLCVNGRDPRTLSLNQIVGLQALSRQVVAQLELRRSLAELDLARDAALKAGRAKSQFLANMSHEIRTQMNSVVGMAGMLLDTSLNRKQCEFVGIIRQSGDLMLTVIRDILDFSKIDAGTLTFETLDFELGEVVESTLELVSERAETKGLELLGLVHYSVHTDLRGDAGRLRQILTNILGNAIKFTNRGEVILRVTQEAETATGVVVRFEVKDTGIGISSVAQRHLFEAFNQENSPMARKYGGAGLGLAIARQLVGMMRGEIGVASELEKGSTFWFTAHFEKQMSAPGVDQSKENLVGIRVLIVNDNCSNYILRLHLANLGMRFSAASGCLEALELLRSEASKGDPFRIAILDLMTPEIDGLKLAESIKEDASLVGPRFIMLSSGGRRMDLDLFRAVDLGESLLKPVKQSRLRQCLTTVLSGGATSLALAEQLSVAFPERQTSNRKILILLAEDNLINQEVALHQLEKFGYQADTVADGNGVLKALSIRSYDVILMDCQMPEMDGYETTRTIRLGEQRLEKESPGKLPVYIVAMTANAMHGEREKCLALGMDDYLGKPVRAEELQAAFERWKQALKIKSAKQPLLSPVS